MKLVTWNVNSIRQRLDRTTALLERHAPDIVCLQETKTLDVAFPSNLVESVGYSSATFGQAGRNGVAILARAPIEDVQLGFPGDPVPEQARVISATVGGVRVINVYVVNGKTVTAPEYRLKLNWLDHLVAWISAVHSEHADLVVCGDFNVAPADDDVHDPDAWRGENLASEPERDRIRELNGLGLADVLRLHHAGPGPFSWWDYRAGAFHRGWGLRIDLILASASMAARCSEVIVDRTERKPTAGIGKPSDHAPVIATFEP